MDKITENVIGEVEAYKSNEKFVKIPMKMLAYASPSYATDDEIAVYYEIVYHGWIREMSISHVNVELLYARLQWDKSTPSRGKKRVITALKGLKQKGYISIDSNGEEIDATSYLVIRTPRKMSKLFDEKIPCGNTIYSGYEEVPESIMKIAKADDKNIGQRLKILTYVQWRHNIGYGVCFDEWANVLQVSPSTAKRIIKSLKEEGIINVKSGEYYTDTDGNKRQKPNQYSIKAQREEDEDGYNPTVTQRQNKFMKVADLLMATTDNRMRSRLNLFEYGSDLSEEDMYIYLTTECPIVKEWGKKRFDAISKNVSGKAMVEDWESKARKMMLQPKQGPEKIEAITIVEANPTKVEIDISDFIKVEDDPHTISFRERQRAYREEQERIKKEEDERKLKEEFDYLRESDDDEQEPHEAHIAFMEKLKKKKYA